MSTARHVLFPLKKTQKNYCVVIMDIPGPHPTQVPEGVDLAVMTQKERHRPPPGHTPVCVLALQNWRGEAEELDVMVEQQTSLGGVRSLRVARVS